MGTMYGKHKEGRPREKKKATEGLSQWRHDVNAAEMLKSTKEKDIWRDFIAKKHGIMIKIFLSKTIVRIIYK